MVLERAEIFAKVRAVLSEMFGAPVDAITLETLLVEELDLDSIDAVNLVVRLEKLFGRRIAADDFRGLRSVDDLVGAIVELLEA